MINAPNLIELFNRINEEHFNNVIHSIPVTWNNRMRTTAGYCRYRMRCENELAPYQIDLNTRLFRNMNWNIDKVKNTLIHEMVHAFLVQEHNEKGHTRRFQRMMTNITGVWKNHRCHDYDTSGLQEKRSVQVICDNCGVVGRRARMPKGTLNYHCRKCYGDISFNKTLESNNKDFGKIKIF